MFKVGDMLLCIDNKERENDINLNQVYTFMKYFDHNKQKSSSDRIMLKEVPEKLFMQSRFKVANTFIIKERLNIK